MTSTDTFYENKTDDNTRPIHDELLTRIADYIANDTSFSDLARDTARLCFMDSIGCAILALRYPACSKLLGPIIPGTQLPVGARVLGTNYYLDPILAAFNIGMLIRWLDYNDTWLAAEWGHPSDNLGAILAITDYVNRKLELNHVKNGKTFLVQDILTAMIKAYEIQGILALENSFNRIGFDHVFLVKVASTAIATYLLGGSREQIKDALSQCFVDGAVLRTYRHAPNTGSRKSWAAGDATSRGVKLAWLTMQGEMGYPSALSTHKWGFNDVILKGASLKQPQAFASYVMENILFKIAYPAEFHAQTAVECALRLHPLIENKLETIKKIIITTHESAIRIISKSGMLTHPADRDHCLQYMIAVALLKGHLIADYYEDEFAERHPILDELRNKMQVIEDERYSTDYLDPRKRSIANAIQIHFQDGSMTERIEIEYPLGHRARREEATPLIYKKFADNMAAHYTTDKAQKILTLFNNTQALLHTPINNLLDFLAERE